MSRHVTFGVKAPFERLIVRRVLFLVATIMAAELCGILWMTGGTFIYTLDDPYIHLALSEGLARGHYGINPREVASASSSFLWPFLLVPFVWARIDEWAPLLLNVVATFALAQLVTTLITRALWTTALPVDRAVSDPCQTRVVRRVVVVSVLVLVCTNAIGVVFTGMEHSLQVLSSVMILAGLLMEAEDGRLRWWVIPALVAGPLIRYESLAISASAAAYLSWRGHWKAAGASMAVATACLVAFSAMLLHLGQGILPSSVLAKSLLAGGFSANLEDNLTSWAGWLLLAATACCIHGWSRWRGSPKAAVAVMLVASAALHVVGGRFGWFSRYEIYVWSAVLIGAIGLHGDVLGSKLRTASVTAFVTATLVAGGLAYPYVRILPLTPFGAADIYDQQYQLQRLVHNHLPEPIAALDIGLVSFRNDRHVLDLLGLASLDVLEKLARPTATDWVEPLCHRYGIRLAAVYNVRHVPRGFFPIARMHLRAERTTVAADTVVFFAIGETHVRPLIEVMQAFRNTLPPGVRMTILDPPPDQSGLRTSDGDEL